MMLKMRMGMLITKPLDTDLWLYSRPCCKSSSYLKSFNTQNYLTGYYNYDDYYEVLLVPIYC